MENDTDPVFVLASVCLQPCRHPAPVVRTIVVMTVLCQRDAVCTMQYAHTVRDAGRVFKKALRMVLMILPRMSIREAMLETGGIPICVFVDCCVCVGCVLFVVWCVLFVVAVVVVVCC